MGDELDQTVLARLVADAKAGDGRAFAALYDAYAAQLYRFLLLRVRQPADAEDLLQRVFMKVVEALPRYEDRGLPFGAWLFRIARNVAIDFERARPSHEALSDEQRDAAERQPAVLAEIMASRTAIRAALEVLTKEQRDVIVYRFFAGLSPREIASLMGKREGSIRAMQFRALAALRRHLEAVGETDPRLAEAGA